MKHIKSVNEFFDFFKKDPEDEIALEFIKRLKKIKDVNPYKIEIMSRENGNIPHYIIRRLENNEDSESYSIVYLVTFEDVELLISNAGHNLYYVNTGEFAEFKKAKYPHKLYIAGERLEADKDYRKKIFELVDKNYKDDVKRKRVERIHTEINPAADLLEASNTETEIIFKHKRNPSLEIKVNKTRDGRITNIENETGIRFPFSVGQLLQRNVETWACNNNFLMDGKDTCPEKKIFGVRTKDVPQGHEWRHIYPNKF